MPKFSKQKGGTTKQVAVKTGSLPALTFEGGAGQLRDPRSELFMLAAGNFVGERTFYEGKGDRDLRYRQLVQFVATHDPGWMQQFIPFLRNRLHMRSASLVAALEYAAVQKEKRGEVIQAAIVRGDEPAEALGYWLNTYGRPVPPGIRRAIAKSAVRLYNERNALKWDGQTRDVRMADVIEMCHPKPKAEWQSALFNYLLTVRHGNEPIAKVMDELTMISNAQALRSYDKDTFLSELLEDPNILSEAGMTWEAVGERVPDGMTGEVWDALIPNMGLMALIRNLRNFEEAGVSEASKAIINTSLMSKDMIARSRQFPIRFYSAWKHSGTMTFGVALEAAVQLSLLNVPELKGRSLIMVDQSGSMRTSFGGERGKITNMEVASLFGMAMAMRCEDARLVYYGTKWLSVEGRGNSLLRNVEVCQRLERELGGGTNTSQVLTENYGYMQKPHGNFDRVIIITDEQQHPAWGASQDIFNHVSCPLYTFNLVGYRVAQHENGVNNKYAFGGLSDAAFSLLPLLEAHQNAGWDALFGGEEQ